VTIIATTGCQMTEERARARRKRTSGSVGLHLPGHLVGQIGLPTAPPALAATT
jgi:hypothetical protein